MLDIRYTFKNLFSYLSRKKGDSYLEIKLGLFTPTDVYCGNHHLTEFTFHLLFAKMF